jgi:hypothetical protein
VNGPDGFGPTLGARVLRLVMLLLFAVIALSVVVQIVKALLVWIIVIGLLVGGVVAVVWWLRIRNSRW